MADPLSIAASVTGLIAVAGQIANTVSKFIAKTSDAPASTRVALSSIEEMRLALISVKQVMDRLQAQPRHRRQMIHVRHLVIVFRESVISVSKLEAILKPVANGGVMDRLKWLREEEKIMSCLTQLESHKNTFSFILNVLQSESEVEAQESRNSLRAIVQQLVEQNQEILIRLEQHECGDEASTRFFDDDTSTVRTATRLSRSPVSVPPDVVGTESGGVFSTSTSQEFHAALEASRVYRRVQSYDFPTDASFTTSRARSHAWTMLSELSLSDVSAVSVIALPLTLDEINAIGSQLSFASIFVGQDHVEDTGATLGVTVPPGFRRFPASRIPKWRLTKSNEENMFNIDLRRINNPAFRRIVRENSSLYNFNSRLSSF